MEQAATDDQCLGWLLDVEDPGTGGHPLCVAVGDDSAPAVRIAVLEDTVDHVGDGLEAAMRMPRRSLGLAGGVLDLAHLIEVDERVEIGELDAVECPADREAFALEAVRGDRDALDRALARDGRVDVGDAGQDGDVVDSDGWHGLCMIPGR